MALFRRVRTSFWTLAKVAEEFTATDRYLYIYLLTNSHTNLCGCYEISIRLVEQETGLSRDDIRCSLQRLKDKHGFIGYSEDTKEVLILDWLHDNWTKSPKAQRKMCFDISIRKNSGFRRYLWSQFYELKERGSDK